MHKLLSFRGYQLYGDCSVSSFGIIPCYNNLLNGSHPFISTSPGQKQSAPSPVHISNLQTVHTCFLQHKNTAVMFLEYVSNILQIHWKNDAVYFWIEKYICYWAGWRNQIEKLSESLTLWNDKQHLVIRNNIKVQGCLLSSEQTRWRSHSKINFPP